MEMVVTCPHCNESVVIEKLNCGIFRHGVIKRTGRTIKPHASREVCENLIKHRLIYGCGKPFRIVKTPVLEVTVCDYI
jgi:hypothetical protein